MDRCKGKQIDKAVQKGTYQIRTTNTNVNNVSDSLASVTLKNKQTHRHRRRHRHTCAHAHTRTCTRIVKVDTHTRTHTVKTCMVRSSLPCTIKDKPPSFKTSKLPFQTVWPIPIIDDIWSSKRNSACSFLSRSQVLCPHHRTEELNLAGQVKAPPPPKHTSNHITQQKHIHYVIMA